MSQSIGHILIAHYAMNNVCNSLLSVYPSYVYNGAQGPDWFYNRNLGFGGYGAVSDAIHSYGSRAIYKGMLDKAGQLANDGQAGEEEYRNFEKACSFAHGFITHVAADCVFHPYVNRKAGNAWNGEKQGDSAHAGVETVIDNLLWANYNAGIDLNVNCCDPQNSDLADFPVRQLMYAGLIAAYSDQQWLIDQLNLTGDIDMDNHPINEAFQAVNRIAWVTELDETFLHRNFNDLIQHAKGISLKDVAVETGLNAAKTPWCTNPGNEGLCLSAEELFKLAIKAATMAISAGERYIKGEINTLDYCGVPFLEKDYNFDTGLPSDYNAEIHETAPEKRFSVGIQQLVENYNKFMTS